MPELTVYAWLCNFCQGSKILSAAMLSARPMGQLAISLVLAILYTHALLGT
jgi:hypothetical protein